VGDRADGKQLRMQASEAAGIPRCRETARHPRSDTLKSPGSSSTGPRAFAVRWTPSAAWYLWAFDRFEAPGDIKWTIVSRCNSDFLGPVIV